MLLEAEMALNWVFSSLSDPLVDALRNVISSLNVGSILVVAY